MRRSRKRGFRHRLNRTVSYVSEVFYRFKTRIALSILFSMILSVSFPLIYVVFLLLYTMAKSGQDEPVISQLSLYALSPGMYILEVKSDYKDVYNIFTFIPMLNLLINFIVFFILVIAILNLSAYIFKQENIRERLSRLIEIRDDNILLGLVKRILK